MIRGCSGTSPADVRWNSAGKTEKDGKSDRFYILRAAYLIFCLFAFDSAFDSAFGFVSEAVDFGGELLTRRSESRWGEHLPTDI